MSAATTRARRGIEPSAGAAGGAIVEHALRQILRGRRTIGLGALVVTPAALALVMRGLLSTGDFRAASEPILPIFVLGLAMPIIALFLGSAVLRDELETGTIVHMATRPVSRRAIVWGRLAAGCAAAVLFAWSSLLLTATVIGGPILERLFGIAWVALAAAPAYTTLFALLGSFTRRAALVGLLFIVAWEGPIASLPTFLKSLTLAYWVRSAAYDVDTSQGFLRDAAGGDPASAAASFLVLVLVALGAAAASAALFSTREFSGPEAE